MKAFKGILSITTILVVALIFSQCSSEESDDSGSGNAGETATLTASPVQVAFEDTQVNENSALKIINLIPANLISDLNISSNNAAFELSTDASTFSGNISIPANSISNSIFVRFTPTGIDDFQGIITIQNADLATDVTVNVSGTGTPIIHNYPTFNRTRVAFGGGFSQSATQSFTLHNDLSNIEAIKMYVKLTCPAGGCDEWDVFANVKVTDPQSGEQFEMARFITPYWNDNSQLPRGFEYDVTDFKSLLTGNTELRVYTECWNARGYQVSIDFDYVEGTPDYPYYEIARMFNYDGNSLSGIPYGRANNFDVTRTVNVPTNSQSTHLRTIISGWGQAASGDQDGRTCAEWCYRTHDVLINGSNMFQHDLGPLGCAANPVNNQSPGNWTPDRAGWCPGMEVPTRIDNFTANMAGSTFTFEYDLEDWTNNTSDNSFYAISTFVVVKSDSPISRPVVID